MGKASTIVHHDYMRIMMTFEDGTKFDVNLGRHGHSHKAEPSDAVADRLSCALDNVIEPRSMKVKDYQEYFDRLKPMAEKARDRVEMLRMVTATFGVADTKSADLSKSAKAPKVTGINRRQGALEVRYADEAIILKVSNSSVSLTQWPDVKTRGDRIMTMASGTKALPIDRSMTLDVLLQAASSATSLAGFETTSAKAIADLVAATAPVTEVVSTGTRASVEKKRGYVLKVAFENGDKAEVKLSGKSIGHVMVPASRSAEKAVIGTAFSAKQASILDDEALATALQEAALSSRSLAEWGEKAPSFIQSAQAIAVRAAEPGEPSEPAPSASPRFG